MNNFAKSDTPTTPDAGHHSRAIVLAWAVEIIAVGMGLVLAVFAGIEGSDSGAMAIIVATLPFIALSVIELMKIPLVALAFKVHSNVWRVLAIIALLFVTLATFQNFVFGFERGFNERIRVVETAQQAFQNRQNEAGTAASRVKQLEARQKDFESQIADLDKRVNAIREQAQSDIANTHANDTTAALIKEREQLQTELGQIEQRRSAETTAEFARCRAAQTTCYPGPINARWNKQRDQIMTRLAAIDDQMKTAHDQATTEMTETRANRDTELANLNKQRADLQHQLDGARDTLADAQVQSLRADAAVTEVQHTRDLLVDRSQLHRLSDVIFGNHENAALERTKKLFVVSLAAIVAVIGSIIAAMYYATQVNVAAILNDRRIGARQRHLMWRAIRSYYANKRLNLIQEKTILKEVPIDRLKLVFLPADATEEDIKRVREEALKSARPAVGTDRECRLMAERVIEEWTYYNEIILRRAVRTTQAVEDDRRPNPPETPPSTTDKPPAGASAHEDTLHIVVPLHPRTGPASEPGSIIDHVLYNGPPAPLRREAGPVIDHPPLDRITSSSTSVIAGAAHPSPPYDHPIRTAGEGNVPPPIPPRGIRMPLGAPEPSGPPRAPSPKGQPFGVASASPRAGVPPAPTTAAASVVQPVKHRDWTWVWIILAILLLIALILSLPWLYGPPHPIMTYVSPPPVTTSIQPSITSPARPPTPTGSEVPVTNFTQFQTVQFRGGQVVTGWNFYRNGDSYPYNQYCYYIAPEDGPGETLLGAPVSVPSSPKGVTVKYDIEDRPGSVKPLPDKLRSSLGQQGWNEARSKCIWHD